MKQLFTQKKDPNTLQQHLRQFEESKRKEELKKALSDPRAWAAGRINEELAKNMSQFGMDNMYKMAAIAEGMLGYYLDYQREVEKTELDFTPILDRLNPSQKERKELHKALKWGKENLEYNFAHFYKINKLMVDMCNRADRVQQEKLNQIEEEIYDDVVTAYNTKDTRLQTYLKQGESNEAYFATPVQLCELLSQLSNGLLYLTPQSLAKQLKQAGYRSELRKAGKHRVRFFYVELVK